MPDDINEEQKPPEAHPAPTDQSDAQRAQRVPEDAAPQEEVAAPAVLRTTGPAGEPVRIVTPAERRRMNRRELLKLVPVLALGAFAVPKLREPLLNEGLHLSDWASEKLFGRQRLAAEELFRGPVAQVKPLVQERFTKLGYGKRSQRQHRNQLQQFATIHASALGRSDDPHWLARRPGGAQHGRGGDFFLGRGVFWNPLCPLGIALIGWCRVCLRRLLFFVDVVGHVLPRYEQAC